MKRLPAHSGRRGRAGAPLDRPLLALRRHDRILIECLTRLQFRRIDDQRCCSVAGRAAVESADEVSIAAQWMKASGATASRFVDADQPMVRGQPRRAPPVHPPRRMHRETALVGRLAHDLHGGLRPSRPVGRRTRSQRTHGRWGQMAGTGVAVPPPGQSSSAPKLRNADV